MKHNSVPATRFGRLTQLGVLAGGLLGGAISEGAKQLAQGQRPSTEDLLLNDSNLDRLTDRLSRMRGAAMKLGQLLSMESGELLPKNLATVLSSLRENAHQMPLGQVARVLQKAWGENWEKEFERFYFSPLAAASIGQVHEALLRNGQRLAIKVQYPGVRQSIDSDVNNVASLLQLFNLVPEGLDIASLLEEAKRGLHAETDYRTESDAMSWYGKRVEGDPRYLLPCVIDSLSTAEVLTMSYLDGEPIEALNEYPAMKRNAAASALLELALKEVFKWGLVQTDPNFANYKYQPASGRIALLDFGATRQYSPETTSALHKLLAATVAGEEQDIDRWATRIGYLGESDPSNYRSAVINLLRMVSEPLRSDDDYHFGASNLAARMSEALIDLRLNSSYGRMPPADILYLHRKLGGTYLLLSRLRSQLPVRKMAEQFL